MTAAPALASTQLARLTDVWIGTILALSKGKETTMKIWISVAALVMLAGAGQMTSIAQASTLAQSPSSAVAAAQSDDNMTPYRKMAAETLAAFKAHDMAGAKKNAKRLETAWDNDQKDLKKKSPDVWNQIDKAMDEFIRLAQDKSAAEDKVQAAYDAFIGKLQLAVRGGIQAEQ